MRHAAAGNALSSPTVPGRSPQNHETRHWRRTRRRLNMVPASGALVPEGQEREDRNTRGDRRRTKMAVMTVQEFEVEEDDLSTTNYDAGSERLNIEADPPPGLIVHTAGLPGNGPFPNRNLWGARQAWREFPHVQVAAAPL